MIENKIELQTSFPLALLPYLFAGVDRDDGLVHPLCMNLKYAHGSPVIWCDKHITVMFNKDALMTQDPLDFLSVLRDALLNQLKGQVEWVNAWYEEALNTADPVRVALLNADRGEFEN